MLAEDWVEVRQAFRVYEWDDQQVARRDGLDVHEGNASVVAIHNARRNLAGYDVAEDAGGHVRVANRIYLPNELALSREPRVVEL
jgi:hypothetical protein